MAPSISWFYVTTISSPATNFSPVSPSQLLLESQILNWSKLDISTFYMVYYFSHLFPFFLNKNVLYVIISTEVSYKCWPAYNTDRKKYNNEPYQLSICWYQRPITSKLYLTQVIIYYYYTNTIILKKDFSLLHFW